MPMISYILSRRRSSFFLRRLVFYPKFKAFKLTIIAKYYFFEYILRTNLFCRRTEITMNCILDFFENFDMPCAAAELSGGRTVYMNKKARKTLTDEYKISLDESEKALLRHGEFLRRTIKVEATETAAEVQTTLIESDGKTLVFEIQTALTSPADGSSSHDSANWASCAFCCAMQAEKPDDSPRIMLKKACEALNAERIFLYEKCGESGYVLSCEYSANGSLVSELSQEICAQTAAVLSSEKRLVIVNSGFAERYGQPLSDILSARGIHSFAAVPVYDGEDICGFCCAENFPVCVCGKTSEALEAFCSAGVFIGSCIKWGKLFDGLKKMGLTDNLTGIGNRHAMNMLEAELKEPAPLGLVFCDISGLKHINDTLGHCAGDEYIQNACEIMKRLFPSEKLFRIGGDELLAVLTNTSEAEVDEKTAALKSELERSSIAMAVGSAFGITDGGGMGRLLLEAETKMYRDKTDYYRRSGRERRRY